MSTVVENQLTTSIINLYVPIKYLVKYSKLKTNKKQDKIVQVILRYIIKSHQWAILLAAAKVAGWSNKPWAGQDNRNSHTCKVLGLCSIYRLMTLVSAFDNAFTSSLNVISNYYPCSTAHPILKELSGLPVVLTQFILLVVWPWFWFQPRLSWSRYFHSDRMIAYF